MKRFRLFSLLPLVTLGFSFLAPLPAAQANPLERLHKRIWGDDDDDKKDKKKKKDKDDDDDDHKRFYSQHKCWDHDRSGHCDGCGRGMVVKSPVIQVRPSYGHSHYSHPYHERTYVEPAPRTYYSPRPIEADVQLALRRRGYYHGPIDGDLGPGSRAAIRDYQYDRGLAVTGRIDTALLRSLGL